MTPTQLHPTGGQGIMNSSDGSDQPGCACSCASKACLNKARWAVGGQQAWPSMVGASKMQVVANKFLGIMFGKKAVRVCEIV
ncbi:MAG: hypothetical protein FRX49_01033 [Trebouxia sp. A1-2]|nr:MAG: hypothetical protein FRX49_01033 [Trebouxia sp. A1-2]